MYGRNAVSAETGSPECFREHKDVGVSIQGSLKMEVQLGRWWRTYMQEGGYGTI